MCHVVVSIVVFSFISLKNMRNVRHPCRECESGHECQSQTTNDFKEQSVRAPSQCAYDRYSQVFNFVHLAIVVFVTGEL